MGFEQAAMLSRHNSGDSCNSYLKQNSKLPSPHKKSVVALGFPCSTCCNAFIMNESWTDGKWDKCSAELHSCSSFVRLWMWLLQTNGS